MRVLHLDAGSEMRGGQWQVFRLLEGLTAAGIESTLVARPRAPLFETACRQGWRVEPWGLTRVLQLFPKYDLIHVHDARSHTLAALLPRARLVVSRRVAFPARTRWKYRVASRYIAVSEFVKSVLIESGVSAEKITVIYDGVPLLKRASGVTVLAPANAADRAKGAHLAGQAAALANVPLEFSADLESDLRRAGVFLYITFTEGLGSAALLAMAAAVPVIASDIGGLKEVICDGINGLLVPNSPEAIAAALRELTANPELARRLGSAGRKTVEERFTSEHMVSRTMEVYRQVLA